jgi:hypothetical protein
MINAEFVFPSSFIVHHSSFLRGFMLGEYPTANSPESEPTKTPLRIYAIIGGVTAAVLIVFGVFYWMVLPGANSGGSGSATKPNLPVSTDHIAEARALLTPQKDLATCAAALRRINLHLNEKSSEKPAPFTAEQLAVLEDKERFALPKEDIAEIDRSNVTPLDAHHLEACYLMREAAGSLGVDGSPQLDQLNAAFAWTMRQVRLNEPKEAAPPLPLSYVLRRGWGSAVERGLIFLALVEQLPSSPVGCLIGKKGASGDYDLGIWACGVVVEIEGKPEVKLFDPRLGLALPGTLSQLLADEKKLDALTIDSKWPYDVKPERVKGSALYVAAPLSALAPRMRYYEAKLGDAQGTKVKMVDPFQTLARLTQVTADDKNSLAIQVWRPALNTEKAALLLKHDSDMTPQARQKMLEQPGLTTVVIDFQRQRALLPPYLLNMGSAGDQLLGRFFSELEEDMQSGGGRDRLVRGDSDQASRRFEASRTRLKANANRASGFLNAEDDVRRWCDEMATAGREVSRLRFEMQTSKDATLKGQLEQADFNLQNVWKKGRDAADALIGGIAAKHRLPEVTFQLALSHHELAEQQEQSVERIKRSRKPSDGELQALKERWTTAANHWNQALQEPAPTTPAAQRNRARALDRLGRANDAAALLEALPDDVPSLEKTARLYQAKQLKGN